MTRRQWIIVQQALLRYKKSWQILRAGDHRPVRWDDGVLWDSVDGDSPTDDEIDETMQVLDFALKGEIEDA